MVEKYLRDHEFVRHLGDRAERAGREIATAADVLVAESDRDDGSADPTLGRRVRQELPRRLAEAIDGDEKNGVEFRSRWLSPDDADEREPTSGANLGIVFEARLPNFQVATAALVRTAAGESMPGRFHGGDLAADAARMLERTPASFVFVFPVAGRLRVVPANAIVAVANDGKPLPVDFSERLYARSLGRFVEELIECFVGDHRLARGVAEPQSWEQKRRELLAFGHEQALESVLYLGVQKDLPEYNLITDFE